MSSPLVRRLRLAATMRDLRLQSGLTALQLAEAASTTNLHITRIENVAKETGRETRREKRRPNTNVVISCLGALGVKEGSKLWTSMVHCSRDANRRGWWDHPEWKELGERQQQYADIESGARWIGLYNNCLVPAVLQTREFVRARDEVFARAGITVDALESEARLRRQAELLRDDGPAIDVLLEEQVIRRLVVEPGIMAEQLQHLLDLAKRHKQITIRVVPVECSFVLGHVPRTPIALHTFSDPEDGTALMIETVTDEVLMSKPVDVAPYMRLFEQTGAVALSEADSARFIAQHAAKLAASKK